MSKSQLKRLAIQVPEIKRLLKENEELKKELELLRLPCPGCETTLLDWTKPHNCDVYYGQWVICDTCDGMGFEFEEISDEKTNS